MKKTYQNIFGASLALVTFSFIGDASAQSCVTPPTCESLGYIYSQAECSGHSFVKCPFDTNFGYCDLESDNKKSCSDGGYSDIKISGLDCRGLDYEGLTCYNCIALKNCFDGGFSPIEIAGLDCSKINYEGNSCYDCVVAKSCADGGYSNIKISGLDCKEISYKGLTCYNCSKEKTCADGGYETNTVSGMNCTKISYEGKTCYNCKQKSCEELGYRLDKPAGRGWTCKTCPTNPSKYLCTATPCPSGTMLASCDKTGSLYFMGYSGNFCCYSKY